MSGATAETPAANRAGLRDGKVSEFTVIAPMKPGGADRLRSLLASREGRFSLADKIGSVHDMRFVFIENDSRLLFATAYDGDWDSYINDFATLIPDTLDLLFSEVEGWPGIKSPQIKDWIVRHQLTAAAWYCAYPDATVQDIRRAQRISQRLDDLLDAAQS